MITSVTATAACIGVDSPIGRWLIEGGDHITRVTLDPQPAPSTDTPEPASPLLREAADRLNRYFTGQPVDFDDLPLRPAGTDFQQRVWHELRAIPSGQTISYRQLAERLGDPAAVRAVGRANGANPIPVFIPCHRVIAASGKLQGYAYGLPVKQFLLDLETPHLWSTQPTPRAT